MDRMESLIRNRLGRVFGFGILILLAAGAGTVAAAREDAGPRLPLSLSPSSADASSPVEPEAEGGRFHLFWLPGRIYPSYASLSDKEAFPTMVDAPTGASLATTRVYSQAEGFRDRSAHEALHFRIEYSIRKWLSLGLEYLDLGSWEVSYSPYWDFPQLGPGAYGHLFSFETIHSRAILLCGSARWELRSLAKGVWASASLGLGPSLITTSRRVVEIENIPFSKSPRFSGLAWQFSGGLDYFFSRHTSLGLALGYGGVPANLPELAGTVSAGYSMDDPADPDNSLYVRRPVNFTIPKRHFDLGGTSVAIRVGIHL